MVLIKNKKNKIALLVKLALLLFVFYVVVTFINLQIQINSKKSELERKTQEIAVQEVRNKEIGEVLESNDEQNKEYIEKIAREELGFAKEGERVFVGVPGN